MEGKGFDGRCLYLNATNRGQQQQYSLAGKVVRIRDLIPQASRINAALVTSFGGDIDWCSGCSTRYVSVPAKPRVCIVRRHKPFRPVSLPRLFQQACARRPDLCNEHTTITEDTACEDWQQSGGGAGVDPGANGVTPHPSATWQGRDAHRPCPGWNNFVVVYPRFPQKRKQRGPVPHLHDEDEDDGGGGGGNGRGCMHPKLFLLHLKEPHSLRVIITSANLNRPSWEDMGQVVWVQDFPPLRRGAGQDDVGVMSFFTNQFQSTLASMLARMLKNTWKEHPDQMFWLSSLANYDFSGASTHLIASVPTGYLPHSSSLPPLLQVLPTLSIRAPRLSATAALSFPPLLCGIACELRGVKHVAKAGEGSELVRFMAQRLGLEGVTLADILTCTQGDDSVFDEEVASDGSAADVRMAGRVRAVPVTISPNPTNAHDPNAHAVCVDTGPHVCRVGFVPKFIAGWLTPLMDAGLVSVITSTDDEGGRAAVRSARELLEDDLWPWPSHDTTSLHESMHPEVVLPHVYVTTAHLRKVLSLQQRKADPNTDIGSVLVDGLLDGSCHIGLYFLLQRGPLFHTLRRQLSDPRIHLCFSRLLAHRHTHWGAQQLRAATAPTRNWSLQNERGVWFYSSSLGGCDVGTKQWHGRFASVMRGGISLRNVDQNTHNQQSSISLSPDTFKAVPQHSSALKKSNSFDGVRILYPSFLDVLKADHPLACSSLCLGCTTAAHYTDNNGQGKDSTGAGGGVLFPYQTPASHAKAGRGAMLRHSKLCVRLLTQSSRTDEVPDDAFGVVYSGSHNFSPSAWGRGGNVHSYELGVAFIVPRPDNGPLLSLLPESRSPYVSRAQCFMNGDIRLSDLPIEFIMDPEVPPYPPTPEVEEDELSAFRPPAIHHLRLARQAGQMPLVVTLPLPQMRDLQNRPFVSDALAWVVGVMEMHYGISPAKAEALCTALDTVESTAMKERQRVREHLQRTADEEFIAGLEGLVAKAHLGMDCLLEASHEEQACLRPPSPLVLQDLPDVPEPQELSQEPRDECHPQRSFGGGKRCASEPLQVPLLVYPIHKRRRCDYRQQVPFAQRPFGNQRRHSDPAFMAQRAVSRGSMPHPIKHKRKLDWPHKTPEPVTVVPVVPIVVPFPPNLPRKKRRTRRSESETQ